MYLFVKFIISRSAHRIYNIHIDIATAAYIHVCYVEIIEKKNKKTRKVTEYTMRFWKLW